MAINVSSFLPQLVQLTSICRSFPGCGTDTQKIKESAFLKDLVGSRCGLVDQASVGKESSLMSLELKGTEHFVVQGSMMASIQGNNVFEVLDAAVASVFTF